MRRGSILSFVLAALLATVGCLGALGGGGPSPTLPGSPPSPTASPSPTATPRPTPTPDVIAFPQGAAGVGSTPAEQFADSHAATLRNTSFTIRYSRVRTLNGTTVTREVGRVQYDGNGTVYHNYTRINHESGSPVREHVGMWSNGTTARRLIKTANGTTVEDTVPITTPPTFRERVEVYFRLFETRTTGYSRLGGEPIARVWGTSLDRGGPWLTTVKRVFGFVEVRRGQFSADVTDSMLRRYRVRLIGLGAPEAPDLTVVTVETVFTKRGTTTIRRPRWVTTANQSRSDTPTR